MTNNQLYKNPISWWEKITSAKKTLVIIQFFCLIIYLFAYLAYIGEAGHFRLTPQLIFWLLGAMFWLIGYVALTDSSTFFQRLAKYLSVFLFFFADLLIILFILGMIDFSVTSRGYRRLLGLVIPITESPPQIKTVSEIFKKENVNKELRFYSENGKNWIEIDLKFKPIFETVNFWEGVLSFPPGNFHLGSGTKIISETNFTEGMFLSIDENSYSVRYSYDTKENRDKTRSQSIVNVTDSATLQPK